MSTEADKGKRKLPLVPVDPQGHREDGSPVAGDGQVYVTRSGKLFHTRWCPIMAAHWRDVHAGIYVSAMDDVGPRGSCSQCGKAPEEMERSKAASAERHRLNQELDRLGRIIARTLVTNGPGAVNELRPHVLRFRETDAELSRLLSGGAEDAHTGSDRAVNG